MMHKELDKMTSAFQVSRLSPLVQTGLESGERIAMSR